MIPNAVELKEFIFREPRTRGDDPDYSWSRNYGER